MIACGSSFSLALTEAGIVYSWGDGDSGALGHGKLEDVDEPKKIEYTSKKEPLPPVKFIAAGYSHAMCITQEAEIYTWGSGESGQLGTGNLQNTTFPTKAILPRVKMASASCGMYHTMAVTEDQLLFATGANKNGQLGLPDMTNRNKFEEVLLFKDEPVIRVACGANHTLVLTYSRHVKAFGNNKYYKCAAVDPKKLGQNITIPVEVDIPYEDMNDFAYQIAASMNLSMAITKQGHIFTWGKDSGGLLGWQMDHRHDDKAENDEENGDFDRFKPRRVQGNYLKNTELDNQIDKLSIGLKELKASLAHTVALTNAGELYVWGSNSCGQHGISTEDIHKNFVLKNKGKVSKKVEDLPPEAMPTLVPFFDIKLNKKVTNVAAGYEHIIAVENFTRVFSWGRNLEGQLGLGDSSRSVEHPSQINQLTGYNIREVAASETHSFVLIENGDLYAFGSPMYGKLGIGVTSSLQLTPKKVRNIGFVNPF